MKLLSYHPFSLYGSGGGARILRRLYEGNEAQITSLITEFYDGISSEGEIREISVPVFPIMKPWMRWHLRKWNNYLQTVTFRMHTVEKICRAAREIPYDVAHVVNHGAFSAALCEEIARSGKELWASFHDHFSTTGSSFDDAAQLWRQASRRLVISENIGNEYSKLFGQQPFELITDGVTKEEITMPIQAEHDQVVVYFAGLLHYDYYPLFRVLADALSTLAEQGRPVKLLLRGTQRIDFLESRTFEVEYKPLSVNNAELKQELDSATILYLPMKFTTPDFYLYSLSTKMIGYLAAPGSILYHGPAESAASKLLQETDSAAFCHSLQTSELVHTITQLLCGSSYELSKRAKHVAEENFDLSQIRKRFWNVHHAQRNVAVYM